MDTEEVEDEGVLPDPYEMATSLAEGAAEAMRAYGYPARFDADSFAELDRLLDEHSAEGKPKKGGFFDPPDSDVPNIGVVRIRMLGIYLGETMIRTLGGAWFSDEKEYMAILRSLMVRLPNGYVANPIGKVRKRFDNGPEDSIEGFAAVVMVLCGINPNR